MQARKVYYENNYRWMDETMEKYKSYHQWRTPQQLIGGSINLQEKRWTKTCFSEIICEK